MGINALSGECRGDSFWGMLGAGFGCDQTATSAGLLGELGGWTGRELGEGAGG